MVNILFITLICLVVVIHIIEYKENQYYKEAIEVEKLIAFFSKTRMDVIKMVHLGEIKADSCYFKYILSATSYSIRALYFYKSKKQALENIAILKEMSPYLLDKQLIDEFKDLNNEQKQIFVNTISTVLKIYWDSHYVEKLLFKLCYQKATKLIKNVNLSKLRKFIPQSTQSGVDYSKKLNDFSNLCYA